ncbi:MAG: hypothetical protein A2992_03390 [Elusimicrobia bacterium RIFCSPLOWO2_01_FULL_59_12]|nr:MAG: hypothetical protein A2992_03390 [Elusimicrobia bacterium RIFCSPLOWO2_01_FULL_59_12]
MKNALSLAILASLFCGTSASAESTVLAPEEGTVQVTVLDVNGGVVAEAPVYIYGEKRSQFVGGADIPGTTTFSMKEGTYRISSALIRRAADDVLDRFASNEAHVNVVAGDHVSVILTLKSLENPEQRALSYATLHVAELPGNLFYNN